MKTWFITGTSSGLGKILTEKLLQLGHRVAATVRRSDALDVLKAQYGERLKVYVLDVTDGAAITPSIIAGSNIFLAWHQYAAQTPLRNGSNL